MSVADPLGLVGTSIGEGLRVIEVAQHGDMSLVYRVEDPQADACRAFRVYLGVAELREHSRRGLFRSATDINRRIARLAGSHPALVQVYGVGSQPLHEGGSVPCSLTEWLDGVPLEDCLDRERAQGWHLRSAADAFAIMEAPMQAVGAAHEAGIVHRNIKPGNFFVQGSVLRPGALRILDFSLGKIGTDRRLKVSFLTPDYAAPEQFHNDIESIGPSTDVFGLALILVELMLGGRPALRGDDFETLRRASEDPKYRPTPRSLGADVPNIVETVFKKALSVDPLDRYEHAGAFCEALRHALACEGKITSSRVSRVFGVLDVAEPGQATQKPSSRFIPRGRTQVAAIADIEGAPGSSEHDSGPVRSGKTIVTRIQPS